MYIHPIHNNTLVMISVLLGNLRHTDISAIFPGFSVTRFNWLHSAVICRTMKYYSLSSTLEVGNIVRSESVRKLQKVQPWFLSTLE